MNFRWRGRGDERADSEADDALVGYEITAANLIGSEHCSALHCTSLAGVPCSYVDRRGRRCRTAWCPEDREVVAEAVLCRLHAHTMRGIEHEFGTAIHPDINSRTVPIINWMAAAAADDIIATLNMVCYLRGEVLVSEPVRRVYHSVERTRIWEKQWKTLSTTGVSLRVCIASDEAHPNEIHIRVNGDDVNCVPPPWNQALSAPNDADLEWLFQEVLVPIGTAVDAWMEAQDQAEGNGYVAPIGYTAAVDSDLAGHGVDGWVSGGTATDNGVTVAEAAADGGARGDFVYGLEDDTYPDSAADTA